MSDRPPIFVSATSDLKSARQLVERVLSSMGYEPHTQDNAPKDGGELLSVLRGWIDPCVTVIQLVGYRYGKPAPKTKFGRCSYTHYEAKYAHHKKIKVIYFHIKKTYPRKRVPSEPLELTQLQSRYKQELVKKNFLRHKPIGNATELKLAIREIHDKLSELRKEDKQRHSEIIDKFDKQGADLAAISKLIQAAIAPQPLPPGQSAPPPLSPELIEKAKILVQRGNAKDKAIGQIALKQHDEANRIIQQLKTQKDNPIDEAFSLFTLEGNNWYQADLPDKSIEPYEKALFLKQDDFTARNNLALAQTNARLGNISAHRLKAIEIYENTLKMVKSGSSDWAMTQNNLGVAWWNMPTGDKAENLKNAVAAYTAALIVHTKEAFPSQWAVTQNNIGLVLQDLPTGDKAENLKKAIAAYTTALTVHTKEAFPSDWAMTQNNLGIVWQEMPTGDKADNLKKAIAAYTAASIVYTQEAFPSQWATTQNNLGTAWQEMPTGDKAENLKKAIAAYTAALTVRTKEAFPYQWATTQNNLGTAWQEMPTGDKAENLKKAIAAYTAALTVRTKEAFPYQWAMTQNNLGIAWRNMPTGDKAENLKKTIAAYTAALIVYTQEAFPSDWAMTQNNLGVAWQEMPTGDKAENLKNAIAAYKASLSVFTETDYPQYHKTAAQNLETCKEEYESTPAASLLPFDQIPPNN